MSRGERLWLTSGCLGKGGRHVTGHEALYYSYYQPRSSTFHSFCLIDLILSLIMDLDDYAGEATELLETYGSPCSQIMNLTSLLHRFPDEVYRHWYYTFHHSSLGEPDLRL